MLLTCKNTACGGIREPNAVAFSRNCERSEPPSLSNCPRCLYIYIYIYHSSIANIIFNFTAVLSFTCNKTACSGILEPNAVAFTSNNCERSDPPSLSNCRAVYIYIYIIVRTSFRKYTPFLNSKYNFQFYWCVINLEQ